MENKKQGPQFVNFGLDFNGGSSRKRKSSAVNQQDVKPDLISEYCIPWKPRVQNASLLSGKLEDSHVLLVNKTKSFESTKFKHQPQKDVFHYQNSYSGSGSHLNSNTDYHATGTENLCKRLQSSDSKGSFVLHNMPAEDCIEASDLKLQRDNILIPSEAYISLPFSKAYDAQTGKVQDASHFEELIKLRIKNHFADKIQAGMCNMPAENLRPMGLLQQSFLQPNKLSDDMGGRICSQEDNKHGIPCEMGRSSHSSSNDGYNGVLTAGAGSLKSSLCMGQNQSHALLQNEVRSVDKESLGVGLGKISENDGHGDVSIKRETESSEMKNLKHSLLEEFPPRNGCSSNHVDYVPKNDLTRGSLNENCKSHLGNAASVVAEKLWEGSLQLSSSVTVSAVAFFKSGEKLLDMNWRESVEVKGKVRLEAFEKYIQDLPRSRTRGLMVISLCWKDGSSKTGLAGMKEIAEGYKKGRRVGYAQLSTGIDLYICPRTEAIITILAKCGFFKGKAVLEGNRDSLIGCLVWRKNRTSSNPVSKKLESKSNSMLPQTLNFTSNPPVQQAAEKHLSTTQPAEESLAAVSVKALFIESGGENGSEINTVNNSKIHIEVRNPSSGANTLLAASVPNDDSSMPLVLQRSACCNSSPLQVTQGGCSEVEAHLKCCSGQEYPKACLEVHEPISPLLSNELKRSRSSSDDDDLPEFDFLSACGNSQTNTTKSSDTLILNKRVMPEVIQKMDRSGLPQLPNVHAVPVSGLGSDQLMFPRLYLTTNEGKPPLKKLFYHGSLIPLFPSSEEGTGLLDKVTTATNMADKVTTAITMESANVSVRTKTIFDDDDDMPEWCPPDLLRQSLTKSTRSSTALLSKVWHTNFQGSACGPPRSELPFPLPTPSCPPFSSPPPTFPCPKSKSPHPRSLVRGPSPSMGFNSNLVLGPVPRPSFQLPFHATSKQGWRP